MNTRGTPNRRTSDNEAIQNVGPGPVKNQDGEVLSRETRQILNNVKAARENVKTRSGKYFWNQVEKFYVQLETNLTSMEQVAAINDVAQQPGQDVGIPIGAPMGDRQEMFRKVCAKVCVNTIDKINSSSVAQVNTKRAKEWLTATCKGKSGPLYKCRVCSMSFEFEQRLDFTKHLYMHRLKQEDSWGYDMNLKLRKEHQKCNLCEERFDFYFELAEHMKKEHRPKRPHGSSLAVAASSGANKRPKRKFSA